jgi:ABC-type nitrate/sulfonate/bicarbonate transport system ATPase subunit
LNTDTNILQAKNVTKYFEMPAGAKTHVLENISFSINSNHKDGQIVSILAPFGSGKSTLLKIIGGLEKPSSGEVLFNNINYKTSLQKIIYLPEKPSSFPWLNVKHNLTFAAEINSNNGIEKDINNIISLVGLNGYENHFPNNESIGFRFRISLARALIINPEFILIDDSLKNLDIETKEELYDVINLAANTLKITFIFATTNISSAIKLSDSIFLMKKNPGTIFHELKLNKEPGKRLQTIEGQNFSAIKDEIESLFKSKNLIDEISFSI